MLAEVIITAAAAAAAVVIFQRTSLTFCATGSTLTSRTRILVKKTSAGSWRRLVFRLFKCPTGSSMHDDDPSRLSTVGATEDERPVFFCFLSQRHSDFIHLTTLIFPFFHHSHPIQNHCFAPYFTLFMQVEQCVLNFFLLVLQQASPPLVILLSRLLMIPFSLALHVETNINRVYIDLVTRILIILSFYCFFYRCRLRPYPPRPGS